MVNSTINTTSADNTEITSVESSSPVVIIVVSVVVGILAIGFIYYLIKKGKLEKILRYNAVKKRPRFCAYYDKRVKSIIDGSSVNIKFSQKFTKKFSMLNEDKKEEGDMKIITRSNMSENIMSFNRILIQKKVLPQIKKEEAAERKNLVNIEKAEIVFKCDYSSPSINMKIKKDNIEKIENQNNVLFQVKKSEEKNDDDDIEEIVDNFEEVCLDIDKDIMIDTVILNKKKNGKNENIIKNNFVDNTTANVTNNDAISDMTISENITNLDKEEV